MIDVTQHGFVGDGVTSNANAFNALLATLNTGASLYFPAGIYADLYDHRIAGRRGLTIYGDGAASILRRRGNPTGSLSTFTNCADVTIRDLAFDMNGCTQFGGIQAVGAQRWRVERCRFFDGAFVAPTNKDRYSLLFSSAQPNTDLWITDCLIEDLQLDIRNCQRVKVRGNTLLRSPVTGGIEIVSLGRDILIEDVLIEGNYIADTWGAGIGVTLDPASDNDVTMRRVKIVNNTIVLGERTKRAVYLGTNNSATPSTGNRMLDFDISGNTIAVSDGITRTFDALIFGNNSAIAAIEMDGWTVHGNRIRGNGTGVGIDLRRQPSAVVIDNAITGVS